MHKNICHILNFKGFSTTTFIWLPKRVVPTKVKFFKKKKNFPFYLAGEGREKQTPNERGPYHQAQSQNLRSGPELKSRTDT